MVNFHGIATRWHRKPPVSAVLGALAPALGLLACEGEPTSIAAEPSCDGCSPSGPILDPTLMVELGPAEVGTGRVQYILRNTGALTQRVLLRETALASGSKPFDVMLDGNPVAYTGPHVYWGEPAPSDFVSLDPGEERGAILDLPALYDMTQPGQYFVRVLQLAGSTVDEAGLALGWALPALDEGAPETSVSVTAEYVSASAEELVDKAVFSTTDPAVPPGNCSTGQRNTVASDEAQAATFLRNIENRRSGLLATSLSTNAAQLFQNNFGVSSVADRTFILNTYRNINAALPDTQYVCAPETGDRACTNNAGQRVDCCTVAFPTALAITRQPKNVRLCPAYFETDAVGRARTLIHEASHQDRTGPDGEGTADTGGTYQGRTISFPSKHHASSYELYSTRCTQGNCL